jgi:cobalt-zinc-cadmium efflux system membrane fusion protein
MLSGIVLNLFSCKSDEASSNDSQREHYEIPDSLLKTLEIDTVKTSNLTNSIKFTGLVDFNTDKVANIFPLISGVAQNIKVQLGDFVKAGQELGVVRSSEMANYNVALINAETNVNLTARLLSQQQDLFKSGLASEVDVTNAEVAHQQALASKAAAEKVLSINGNNRDGEYIIKSPIDGFIVQKNITNGMSIRTDNATNLFTISDLKQVWVQANVYEGNISKVNKGDEVDVTTISYPDKVFNGKIDNLMNVLDPNSKVMKMRIVLDNPDYLLKPQMFATVIVNNSENKKAVAVPTSSIVFDHSQYYVLLYKSKKDVQIRQVELLSTNGNTAFIKRGVAPGDLLIGSQAILIYGALNN